MLVSIIIIIKLIINLIINIVILLFLLNLRLCFKIEIYLAHNLVNLRNIHTFKKHLHEKLALTV